MGYYTSNTAYAYDMQAAPAYPAYDPAAAPAAPHAGERPRFDVYTGAGRAANQAVSPAFLHVLKVFCVLAALVVTVGLARVTIASMTAAQLNAAAETSEALEAAQDESADLEVMRSVYGSDTRIRELATGTLGMVEPEGRVTVDVSSTSAADAAAQDAAGTAGSAATE